MGVVSYIPVYNPFLKTLVGELMHDHAGQPAELMDIDILLPTRRAVRVMTDLFLDANAGQPLLLPRLRAVADIDDDALEIMVTGMTGTIMSVPPALSSLESELILARMIGARDPDIDFGRAVTLAKNLLSFLKSVEDEGLSLDQLDHIVSAEFATHWQLTLDFLKILRVTWPSYVRAAGKVQAHHRRTLLFDHLITHWQNNPPPHPVIMAGMTGSLPVVAQLMGVVADLPHGHVILPGFNPELPAHHAENLTPQDPHFELNTVIKTWGVDPGLVPMFKGIKGPYDIEHDNPSEQGGRPFLITQMMCPGACTPLWVDISKNIPGNQLLAIENDIQKIKIIRADTEIDEARMIAVSVRLTLNDPSAHIMIVTPDRSLASLIIAACRRFGIEVDDSAGYVLHTSPGAQFMMLVLSVAIHGFLPVDLIGLLRHPFLNLKNITADQIYRFERAFLRGVRPPVAPPDFLKSYRAANFPDGIIELLEFLVDTITPLYDLCTRGAPMPDMIRAHITACEALSHRTKDDICVLWADDDGDVLSRLCTDILNLDIDPDIMTGAHYHIFLTQQFKSQRVNRRGVGHPRVLLLGVYESRLMGATHVILAGFNDGIWPTDRGIDPWFGRHMRADFGMPPVEQDIGRMAHDVYQLLHIQNVTITYRLKNDGVPALPSRWLHRLQSVLSALFKDRTDICVDTHIAPLAAMMDAPIDPPQKLLNARPAPRPPVPLRPTTLSATQMDTLMVNPYAFYAQKILRLSPLDPLDMDVDDRQRGIILHDVLHRVARENRPQDIDLFLTDALDQWSVDAGVRAFMFPRLAKILSTTLTFDETVRATGQTPVGTEQSWVYDVDISGTPHHITARLDRLDQDINGAYHIIDYKTGAALPTRKNIESGVAAQLILQSLCVRDGVNATTEQPGGVISTACLWQLKSSDVKTMTFDQHETPSLDTLCDDAKTGISHVLTIFSNPQTPYYPVPDAHYDDLSGTTYDHLSRRLLWWGLDANVPDNTLKTVQEA